jgi:hypothetical protein
MADALSPYCPDNEEFAHDLLLLGEAADERKTRERLITVNQVAASVGVFEKGGEPPGFVEPFAVRHRAAELGQVVMIQLPQPLGYPSLLGGGDKP